MSGLIATRFGQTFPLGTLVVNVTGSFVIGLFAALSEAEGRWRGLVTLEKIKVIHYRHNKPD